MLLGRDASRRANAILLEFKQWDDCEEHYVPGAIRLGGEEKLHPSAQVRAYRRYLQDTHAVFADGDAQLHSCAFLHDEVGCIYSAQGFEFDYVGVIVGNDLRWDPERRRWFPDLAQNSDTSFKNGLTRDRNLAVQQLAHVYRVLSTRGMKGTYFYFLDPDTRCHFEELLAQP